MSSTDVTKGTRKLLSAAVCASVGLACLASSHLVLADVNAAALENRSSAPAEGVVAKETRVTVRAIELSGNEAFVSDRLLAEVKGELGKPLNFGELLAIAHKIEKVYHDADYRLAKAVIPEQQFHDGMTLRIVVLEGRLGSIEVQSNERYSDAKVRETLDAAGVNVGRVFTLADMEQGLTRLNRLSGIEVTSTLKPGQETGLTDVVVDMKESDRITGAIEANNYGSENSGEYRIMPSISLPNLTGRGDVLSAIAMTSLGSGDVRYGYLDYKSPLNSNGTNGHIYVSKGNVGIGREFRVLEIEGDSMSWGLGLSHDYIFSARTILSVSTWLEAQDLEQTMLGTVTSEDKTRKLRLGVNLDNSDLYGRTLLSFDLHQGLGEALGAMEENAQLSSRSFANADNSFTKVTYDFIRVQQITPRFLVLPRFYGQYAFGSVVSGEQWAIGGINSVVGHPSSAYSGDSGFTASLEGRYTIFEQNDRYQFIARLDHGQIFIKKPLIDQDDKEAITGVSIGLQARPISSIDLRLDWGLPLGSETEDSSYVYAQARYRF